MADDVVIKIGGDIKDYTKALEDAKAKTADLEDGLKKIATISGIAFAALTAEIGFSVAAFGESEKAANQLTAAMQAQGIYSKDLLQDYQRQATALQNLSGVSDEAVTDAQRILQGYLGQIKVTDSLTLAIGNLSAAKGIDLQSTAELIGKGIQGQTTALKKLGIEVVDHGDKQLNMAEIIKKVNSTFAGQAEAAGKGVGAFTKLKETFNNLQEEIGARFAPALEKAAHFLDELLKYVQSNRELMDFAASLIAAGAALAGMITVVTGAAIAFLSLKAALAAAGVAMSAMELGVKALVGATGIGLLLLVATEIYLHWNSIWPRMEATFQAFVDHIGQLGHGLAEIMRGIFNRDTDQIKKGWEESKAAFTDGYAEYGALVTESMREQAKAEQAEETKKVAQNAEIRKSADELDLADRRAAYERTLAANEEFQVLSDDQQAKFREDNDKKNIENQETETSGKRLYAQQRLVEQQKANTTFLIEQQKYGTAYALINKQMHSAIFEGTKTAFGEMAAFQQSSNATLKSIGKAAAIANIIIKTGESAMNIFAGFSVIPFIGPALGVAGAAAAIAFGAEQVGLVTAAAEGGLITGGFPGRDSVPVLAQQGELVSPAQNFNEVIGSVRAMREAQNITGGDSLGGGSANIVVSFVGEAAEFFEAKILERQRLGISLLRAT